jgi:hypothetical protein
VNTNSELPPCRVQLSRKAGWRMPPNTVKVARRSRWGNPYRVEDHGREQAIRLFEADLRAWKICSPDELRALAGKNLACFCRLDEPCHADVLLKLANAPEECR